WAKMPSTVRPARGSAALASGTMGLHDPGVDGDVLIDHALGTEPGHRAIVHTATIEIEHAGQPARHLFEVVEDQAGDAFVHDLPDRTAIERDDRRAASHRLGEDQPKRLARLNRVEQRAGAAVQLHLRLKIGLAEVDHPAAVDMWRHALAIIV